MLLFCKLRQLLCLHGDWDYDGAPYVDGDMSATGEYLKKDVVCKRCGYSVQHTIGYVPDGE